MPFFPQLNFLRHSDSDELANMVSLLCATKKRSASKTRKKLVNKGFYEFYKVDAESWKS